jgi:hypothetical protein
LEADFKRRVPYWKHLYWQKPDDIWNDIRNPSKHCFELITEFMATNQKLVKKANGKGINVVFDFQ